MKIKTCGRLTRYFADDGKEIAFSQPPCLIFNTNCLTASGLNEWFLPVVKSYVPLARAEYRDEIAKIESLHPHTSFYDKPDYEAPSNKFDESWWTEVE